MQVKHGDVRNAATIAMGLLTSGRPLEVQHFGFQLLQTLVRQLIILDLYTKPMHQMCFEDARSIFTLVKQWLPCMCGAGFNLLGEI